MEYIDAILLIVTIWIGIVGIVSDRIGLVFVALITASIGFLQLLPDFLNKETTEFIVQEKISKFSGNYLKSNKGILRVNEIDYLNLDKGDTLIIYKKEINQDLFLFGATILENKKVK